MSNFTFVVQSPVRGVEFVESAWSIAGDIATKHDINVVTIELRDQSLLRALHRERLLEGPVMYNRPDEDIEHLYHIEHNLLEVGQFYPRIYRPMAPPFGRRRPPRDEVTATSSLMQLASAREQLERVFRTIAPESNNFNAYGHEIRNLMLLACTEVESECKGILKANGVKVPKDRWSTKDFVKVRDALRLEQFEVSLPMYPSLQKRTPFRGWDKDKPTESLSWYKAYNIVKHDRAEKFTEAKLIHAVDAVAACAVLLATQYGSISGWEDQVGNFFSLSRNTSYPINETYLFPLEGEFEWKQVKYPF